MKIKSCNLIKAAAFAAMALFAGCSNIDTANTASDAYVAEDGQCTVSVGVAGYENLTTKSSARTINPADYTSSELEDADSYTFKISGQSAYGETLADVYPSGSVSDEGEYTLTFEDGSSKVILSYAFWDLTLTVYNSDGNAVLKGSTSIDLTNGTAPDGISFKLSTSGVTTEGGVKFTVNWSYDADTNAEVTKMVMGLYDRLTKEAAVNETTITDSDTISGKTSSFENSEVEPGSYLFAVTFYGTDSSGNYKKIGYWADTVVVAPGRTTESTITLTDVIMTKPAAPENLMAYLADDSEDGNYYNVKLTWEDKSKNEENFVITIKEYDEDGNEKSTYKVLGVESDSSANKEIFYSSSARVSGSILTNNTEAVIRLKTGHLYDVSIQAQNFAGLSESCTRSAGGTESGCTAYSDSQKINRIMFTYILDGGILTVSGTNYSNAYVTYTTLGASDYDPDLLDPENDADVTLTKDSHPFKSWLDSDGNAVTSYTGLSDASFYANYNADYVVNYTIESFKDFADGEVAVTVDGSSIIDSSDAVSNTAEITVTVTGSKNEYDYFQVDFDGNTKYTGSESSCTFKAGAGKTGNKVINVLARIKDTDTWVGKSYTVEFTN